MKDVIVIDTKGLDCPLPLMEMKKALATMEEGQELILDFTCPEAVVNLPSYCKEHKHTVLSLDRSDTCWTIKVKK